MNLKSSDPPRSRRWLQYRLRTLLVLMLLASVGMSWFSVTMHRAKRQREIVEGIRKSGGKVKYHRSKGSGPAAWAWLHSLLGDDFFAHVRSVTIFYRSTAADLADLKDLPRLRSLNISGWWVTDTWTARVKDLVGLEELYLTGARVTDAGMAHLRGLHQLRVLHLDHTQVGDAGLAHLQRLIHLEQLELKGTNVTDAGLAHLEGLLRLKQLGLAQTHVTDGGLGYLKDMSHLERLSLYYTQVTDKGARTLGEALPNCRIYHSSTSKYSFSPDSTPLR